MYLGKTDMLEEIPQERWNHYEQLSGKEACEELRPIINR